MNRFLELSIEYASQRCYLDDLFHVYPTIPNGIRVINEGLWHRVEDAFMSRDNVALITNLLDLDLFPVKDSYVAFLKRDRSAMGRNPRTVDRLAGEMYRMGIDKLYEKCSLPKEANRQIGPMFKHWLGMGELGVKTLGIHDFAGSGCDAVCIGTDHELEDFARERLGYRHNKGLDFLGRFNGRYVIGEAKFLSDFGGHQNAQLNDALSTVNAQADAIKIAILDGVCYLKGNNKMYKTITEMYSDKNIFSSLLLQNFIYSIRSPL